MKVLVCEIDKKTLFDIYTNYVSHNELTFLHDATSDDIRSYTFQTFLAEEHITLQSRQPYWIDENILNLEKLLQTCINLTNKYPYISANDNFTDLILNIYKQRTIGYKVSNIRYVYEKCKNDYPIQLVDSVNLQGWDPDLKVITGESNLGKMWLSNDGDFVFDIECLEKGLFGKIQTKHMHWHPQSFDNAIEDLKDFMDGNLFLREIK